MTASDPVPAIVEAEATGETAQIFADIRATTGIPIVNLIWRHLATMPGALPWTWGALQPLYASGAVANAAAHLREGLTIPSLPAWPSSALSAAGLSTDDQADIARILASYDRSNAMNLVALAALRAKSDGLSDPTPLPATAPGEGVKGALPFLTPLAEMPEATANLVSLLNAIGDPDQKVLASMYRHLSHWPPFLALVWTRLAPLQASGEIERVIATNLDSARTIARRLAATMPEPGPRPEPAVMEAANASLDLFIRYAIGRMVPIGRMLAQSMPQTSD